MVDIANISCLAPDLGSDTMKILVSVTGYDQHPPIHGEHHLQCLGVPGEQEQGQDETQEICACNQFEHM